MMSVAPLRIQIHPLKMKVALWGATSGLPLPYICLSIIGIQNIRKIDGIRTVDLWSWKRPLNQFSKSLSLNEFIRVSGCVCMGGCMTVCWCVWRRKRERVWMGERMCECVRERVFVCFGVRVGAHGCVGVRVSMWERVCVCMVLCVWKKECVCDCLRDIESVCVCLSTRERVLCLWVCAWCVQGCCLFQRWFSLEPFLFYFSSPFIDSINSGLHFKTILLPFWEFFFFFLDRTRMSWEIIDHDI